MGATGFFIIIFGILFGVATIPFRHKLGGKIESDSVLAGAIAWVFMNAFMAPVLILVLLWVGVIAYRDGWTRYLNRRQWHA